MGVSIWVRSQTILYSALWQIMLSYHNTMLHKCPQQCNLLFRFDISYLRTNICMELWLICFLLGPENKHIFVILVCPKVFIEHGHYRPLHISQNKPFKTCKNVDSRTLSTDSVILFANPSFLSRIYGHSTDN